MSTKAKRRSKKVAPPVLVELPDTWLPRRNYARWRALSLSLVYVVFAVHIIHWKLTGKTLAPLELNEVMYTLELGIITAGFLFMCFLVLGTLVFGRFFCSWACHIMVLQDLCAWILRKCRIRQKPIRSRVLLLVPPLTAFYMFIWPQIARGWHNRAFPTFHLATDSEGWASFVTNNFWRNLPSPAVIALTFVVCGFIIIYLLGTRTFCAYVCPYGAVFGLADRFSPGRIRVDSDKCQQCGTCTAACTTGIRVHEEVKQHGLIVNPACLKDLDCVAACPQSALSYKFMRPSLFKSYKSGGRFGSLSYDFSFVEEFLIAFVFVVVLLSFRGLYSRVPFLLSLALGGIIGYFAVLTVRLFTQPNVLLSTLSLKHLGRVTVGGRIYQAFALLLAAFVAHSGFVRYHEYNGLKQARALMAEPNAEGADALAASAHTHLATADRWGIFRNERVERRMLAAASRLQRFADIETYALRLLERHPDDPTFHAALGGALAESGRLNEAAVSLSEAARLDPDLAGVQYNLGTILGHLGRFAEAIPWYQGALGITPDDAELHNNLGFALLRTGRFDQAREHLERAIAINPNNADAHFNLAALFASRHENEQATRHARIAASLDVRYARLLESTED